MVSCGFTFGSGNDCKTIHTTQYILLLERTKKIYEELSRHASEVDSVT